MILSNAEYHKHSAISKSSLDAINRSPAYYKWLQTHEREETPAMKMGSAVHTAVLEEHEFLDRYVMAPECDRRTKAGKALWAAFQEEYQEHIVLTSKDWNLCMDIANSVKMHPQAARLLQGGQAEVSHFWEEDGVEMRCRPDYLTNDYIVDLKTTQDASPTGFAKSIMNFRYHVQEAHYTASTKLPSKFYFIAVEKTAPYMVGVYQLDPQFLEMGMEARERNIRTLLQCQSLDSWPGYTAGNIDIIHPPSWALPRKEATEW